MSQICSTYKSSSVIVFLNLTRSLKSDHIKLITQIDLTTQASNIFDRTPTPPYPPPRNLYKSTLKVVSQPMEGEKIFFSWPFLDFFATLHNRKSKRRNWYNFTHSTIKNISIWSASQLAVRFYSLPQNPEPDIIQKLT